MKYTPDIWILIIVLINLFSFFLMMLDKIRACRNQWRVRERTLLIWALFFGAPGILAGMLFFRHKIRDWKFKIGIPVLFFLNIFLGLWIASLF